MDERRNKADETGWVRREITQAGMTVTIETIRDLDGKWSLSIYGKRAQMSHWLESFDSSDEAMVAACTAIRYEGIEEFYDDPDFDYEKIAAEI